MHKLASVLLVDDDHTANYLNQRLLNRLGVAEVLLTALNGREALDLLRVHCHSATPTCPVLILLDLKMPVMDGFAFLEAYHQLALAQRQAIIIVMLSTSLHPQDMARIRKLDIASFLTKPLTEEKVNDVLKAYFHRQLPQ